jgi:hypothetical protein
LSTSAAAVAEPEEVAAQPQGRGEVLLGDRYRILADSPLPGFDVPGAAAYVARDLKAPTRLVFARVCAAEVFPRTKTLAQLATLREAHIMRPMTWGTVAWPPDGGARAVTLFERPEGGPLMPSLAAAIPPLPPELLTRRVLGPGTLAVGQLWQRMQTHRAIRPDNMFMGAGSDGAVILGDCVTTPPGWGQPAALEPIELAMTPAAARGAGSIADDVYALGASLLCLAIGHCPLAPLAEEEAIERKLRLGSFVALLGEARPPPGLREPLRGMLEDDPGLRWKLDDIEQWLGGQMRRSGKGVHVQKTDRPFEFAGREYRTARELAYAFGRDPQAAAPAIRGKSLESWLRRGNADTATCEAVTAILGKALGGPDGASADTRLVAQVCMAIDPLGPLRHGPLIATPTALGTALAVAMLTRDQDAVQRIAECLAKDLPYEWCVAHGRETGEDLSAAGKLLKRAQAHLKHAGPGYGIERCLYELAAEAPCLSPVLKPHAVFALDDLLIALDGVVQASGGLSALVDRHIAAFIAARCRISVDHILSEVEDARGDSAKARAGMVRLLAQVQHDVGPAAVPRLARWLAGELDPAVARLRSRQTRERVKKRIDALADAGNLVEIAQLLQNEALFKRDGAAFAAAAREYAAATAQIAELEASDGGGKTLRLGWRIAASLSFAIACATTAVALLW